MKFKPLLSVGFLLCLSLTSASISAETVIIDVKDSMFGTEQLSQPARASCQCCATCTYNFTNNKQHHGQSRVEYLG